MARVSKVALKKIFLARGNYWCPIFSSTNLLYYEGVEIIYEMKLRMNIFYTKQKRWEFIGCLSRLPKHVFNCSVLSLHVKIYFTITIIHNYVMIINYDDESFQDPIFCSKFPWTREIISLKIIDNLATHSQKGRQSWSRIFGNFRILY
jgi:hypothetical protein